MDFDEIRKLTIIALFSDDFLFERLVLKGGNAISLVYKYGSRSSLDIDFSIEQDFEDLDEVKKRAFAMLKRRFEGLGFVVFDESFVPKPATNSKAALEKGPQWGGYQLSFKLIQHDKHLQLKDNLENLRRNALVIGTNQQRVFSADFSKYEYCAGKTEAELDDFTIYVYTETMLFIEKIRAICQQRGRSNRAAVSCTRPQESRPSIHARTLETTKYLGYDSRRFGNGHRRRDALKGTMHAETVPARFSNKIQ